MFALRFGRMTTGTPVPTTDVWSETDERFFAMTARVFPARTVEAMSMLLAMNDPE